MFRSILSSQVKLDNRKDLNWAVTDSPWTLEHLHIFQKLPVHQGCVNSIQWNNGGDLILSGSDDKRLVLTRYVDNKVSINCILL